MTTQESKENIPSKSYKTALLAVILARPEGATLAEMAKELGWKENSIRGAMSALAGKQIGATLTSEKKTASAATDWLLSLKIFGNK